MNSLRSSLKRFGVNRLYWQLWRLFTQLRWQAYRRRGPHRIRQYVTACHRAQRSLMVQVGCGGKALPDWLNTEYDYYPNCVFLDMTQPLPFADGEVEFIVAEHVLEHTPKSCGVAFLRECYRCLKPGGRLRLATPNLTALSRLVVSEESAAIKQTLLERHSRLYRSGTAVSVCDFVNDIHRLWGHCYLYSEEELHRQLQATGFEHVEPVRLGESQEPRLVNVDQHQAGLEMTYLDLRIEAIR